MNALVLADTHIGPHRPGRRLPDDVYRLLDDADIVLHAGDVTTPDLLHELRGFAPVHAVLGNNDVSLSLPERTVVDVDGLDVGLVHDSGPATGRASRLRRWFPAVGLVVFGHSHLPWHEQADGQVHFNPGSPTERRHAPTRTVGWLVVRRGRIHDLEHVEV